MSLAIFDLDNTLLNGDSDYLWGQFLAEEGIIDSEHYTRENRRYYEAYQSGQLDIHAFLRFTLAPLAAHDLETLHAWRRRFMVEKIIPIMLPQARDLLAWHRSRGDYLLILTATNRFVTTPIAEAFGVDTLLATELELCEGRYTGEVIAPPCFQHGKVTCLTRWLEQSGHDLTDSWFYSDSRNDLPLLERVTHPVAVDPDDALAKHASACGWSIISLR